MNKSQALGLLLLLFFLNPKAGFSQRFIGGITGGMNISQIDGDDLAGYNKVGLIGGGYVSTILSDRWQLSLELLYSQQGSRQSSSDGFYGTFDKIQLNFVEVPVLINFKEWKFHVQGGLSYLRLIDRKLIETTGVDVTDQFPLQEGTFSMIFGLTYFSSEQWGYNFRWTKGIQDLQKGTGNSRWLVKNISFRILYLFN